MNLFKAQKMTFVVNTVILLLVIGLACFFYMVDAPFLIYFSIPTALVYLIGYYLIAKEWLHVYVWMVYLWLTIYMCVTTICLGYAYGFHLYCFSMIPVMYVTEYIAYKLERRSLRALYVSMGISLIYLLSTGYVALFGPIYERDQKLASFFWIFNALIVFGFLIFYTNYLIKMIISSEEKLREMAQVDPLTKLYNRRYMKRRLDGAKDRRTKGFLAMADIDDFKQINDHYGHAAGDEVLMYISNAMKEVCEDCDIARWGGEEFMLFAEGESDADIKAIADKLSALIKEKVKAERPVTISVGVTRHHTGEDVIDTIDRVDELMYKAKGQGKDQVCSDL